MAAIYFFNLGSNYMKVDICEKCCLCYGSSRALNTSINENTAHNAVVYKELLHNKRVMETLEKHGIKQKDNLQEFTPSDHVIIRAHGEPKSTFKFLKDNGIPYTDCTCPNVKAINKLVELKDSEGYKIIIVGNYGYHSKKMHPEVYATSHWCNDPILIEDISEVSKIDLSFGKYFLVVQTTFSRDKAEKIIKEIETLMAKNNLEFRCLNTTCRSQIDINEASAKLARRVDKMIVVGGSNSSNTRELFNNVSSITTSYLVEGLSEVKLLVNDGKLSPLDYIGLTGGASTMIEELNEIKDYLEKI